MPTYLLVGIPTAIICVLGGLIAYERYTEQKEARKRELGLKRWLGSQDALRAAEKPPKF